MPPAETLNRGTRAIQSGERMTQTPLNLELIRTRVADIRQEMDVLRGYAALAEAEFADNPEKFRAARYSLVVVVEAAAAICNHLCARRGRAAESYPGCFEMLGDLGIIDAALAGRLAAMARLRNILVHGYGRVDDRRLHRILRTDLGDVDAYLSAVGAVIQSANGDAAGDESGGAP